MADKVGITIVQPKKDVFGSIQTYEAQMLSTNNALVEADRGEANTSSVPHSRKSELPLVLQSSIIDSRTRGALSLASINSTHVLISGSKFYRIFENAQEKYKLVYYDEPDMIADLKIIPYTTVPNGWLECNGQAVSRTTYADLFNIIGTTWGSGDGSTTFNVPNFKGRMLVHLDSSQSEFDALSKSGGLKTITLTTGEMPSHTHTQVLGSGIVKDMGGGSQFGPNSLGSWLQKDGTLNNTGGGGAHNNMPPYMVGGIWIIKATA